ncbi:hypothetical protein CROQUDRAFT_652770 [Cronartium quercuum f. sp. fusiforme G11]|uniref:Uncharacterized protein n=1 Tax=Cronartium quercuum f. sp. fusiforme G11 TaxID=708437 RepID=A0A9P6NMX2_9BASI|nr:hypothetical protein CROQUDRAFT_652770 [Cronartium quercuum f. sp. fusiforme G11]
MSQHKLTYHNISVLSAHNACVLFCKCKDRSGARSFINMGIGPTGQIYLNCAHKDPCKGFKGGCGFFAWLEVSLSQCSIKNVLIIVTVLPSLWHKIKSIPSTPTSPVLGFFQSGGLRMLW